MKPCLIWLMITWTLALELQVALNMKPDQGA